MRQKRKLIAVVLMMALILSSCANSMVADAANGLKTAAAEARPVARLLKGGSSLPPLPRADGAASDTAVHKAADGLFRAKFEGSGVAGSGEAVDGLYRFTATQTDGESWHIKLESNYPTVSGREYLVTYRFRSDVAGKIKFGDFQEFDIVKGDNEVTGELIASDSASYLDLQLGMLPAFTIDFTEIEVKEYADKVTYENALRSPVNFKREALVYERHDQGYAPVLTRSFDEVSINYLAASWEPGVWKSRLYVNTGLVPEVGVHYRVGIDVSCDEDMPFELLLNNGDVEKGYGALYGQEVSAGKTNDCQAVITGGGNGDELVLQFSLGMAPEESTVKVGNLRLERIIDAYTSVLPASFAMDKTVTSNTKLIPTSFTNIPLWETTGFNYLGVAHAFEQHDDGYEVSLEKSASSATMAITKAPESGRGVWKAKLFAATGQTLEAGTTYRIKYKLASAGNQANYEVLFDGDTEGAYGGLYGRSLTAGGTDEVEYVVTPDASHGPLTLRLQLGETDSTAGNTVTLSDLSVETVKVTATDLGAIDYSTVGGNVWEENWDGVKQEVSASGDTATLHVSQARSGDGSGVWSSKLLIATGVTPEPGERYRVSATVAATAELGAFEILYQNGAGGQYGWRKDPSGPGTYSGEFTAPASGCGELVLCFQLGNSAADNTITVSDLGVFKGTATPVNVPLSADFKYPERGPDNTIKNYFDLEANSGAEAILSGGDEDEEYLPHSATARIVSTPGTDDWHIKFYVKPGITLESGSSYKVSFRVRYAKGCQVCFKNTNTEKETGYGDLVIDSDDQTVTKTIAGAGSVMEILLKLGKLSAETEVTISDVKIEKTGAVNVTPRNFAYPDSYFLEANSGADASLSGSGSSATATVITPGYDWNIKFYAFPGVTLESGKNYQVSFQVTGAAGCPACFKNTGTGNETGYGEVWLNSDDVFVTQNIAGQGSVMEIMLKIGNKTADTAVTISNVQIIKLGAGDEYTELELPKYFYPKTKPGDVIKNSFDLDLEEGALAAFDPDPEGHSAIARVDRSGDNWHIKLYAKPGVTLESGKTYRISMYVTGANGCPVVYKNTATGDETGFGQETINGSSTTVTHTVTPSKNGELEILVKMGNVAVNNCVGVSGVKIEEMQYTFVAGAPNLMQFPLRARPPVNFWAHESYEAAVSNAGPSATLTVNKAPDSGKEDWKVKLFVETGIALAAGKDYRISADVSASAATNYEICYNNGAAEAALGKRSGLQATDTAQTVTYETKASSDANLTLQFNLGNAASGTAVTVSNIKVEELTFGDAENLIPDFQYDSIGYVTSSSDEGYVTSLERSSTFVTFDIEQAPKERHPWNAKVYFHTGFIPETGKGYRVSFDVITARGQSFAEVFYDGFEEKTYGGLYGLNLPAGKSNVSAILMPGYSSGELVVQFRPGQTDSMEGNTYWISNLRIDEVTFAPGSVPVVTLDTQPDYIEHLEKTHDKATVVIEKTPAEGREAWKSKLFVDPGVTLRAGQKYRISMNVRSIIPAPFEVCFNNGSVEKGLGAIFGLLSNPSGQYVEYVTTPKKDISLVVQLSLGNCASPNSIILDRFNIEKAGETELVSDTIYTF